MKFLVKHLDKEKASDYETDSETDLDSDEEYKVKKPKKGSKK
jgi:hypothetical protein